MQYKANSTNELKINANITKGHKGKFRLRSTYACGWTDHFHIARWQFPVSSGSLSLNKCHISGRVSQTAGWGAVLGSSLAHGHQRSTICWEHTHFGQIFPAPAFVTTRLPEHNMPWKFPPLWLFALLFSKDEMINHCKSIRLLPEQLAAQRTWQKTRYGPQKVCILRSYPRRHFDTVASNLCGLTMQAGIFRRLWQASDVQMKPGTWGRAPVDCAMVLGVQPFQGGWFQTFKSETEKAWVNSAEDGARWEI